MKYKVVPYIVRINNKQGVLDAAKKVEKFLNQNHGQFHSMVEVPVLIKNEKTNETQNDKLSMWVFKS